MAIVGRTYEVEKLFDVKFRGTPEQVSFMMDSYLASMSKHFPTAIPEALTFKQEKGKQDLHHPLNGANIVLCALGVASAFSGYCIAIGRAPTWLCRSAGVVADLLWLPPN